MASRPKKSLSLKEKPKRKPVRVNAEAAAVLEDDLAHEPPCIAERIRRMPLETKRRPTSNAVIFP